MGSYLSQYLYKDSSALLCDDLHCSASDSSGQIGSLYDVRTNRIVHIHKREKEPVWAPLDKMSRCEWRRGDCKYANTSDLSACLDRNMRARHRFTHLVDRDNLIGEKIILFSYYSIRFAQMLPRSRNDTMEYFPRGTFNNLNINATHIVHGITWGYEVVFVIKLPENVCSDDADHLLNKIYDILEQKKSETLLTNDDQNLWAKFDVHIISDGSPQPLDSTASIQSIIQRIRHFETQYRYPLSYTLQPVRWIYVESLDRIHICISNSVQKIFNLINQPLFSIPSTLIQTFASLCHTIQYRLRTQIEYFRSSTPRQVHCGKQFTVSNYTSLSNTILNLDTEESSSECKTTWMTTDLQSNQYKCIEMPDNASLLPKHQMGRTTSEWTASHSTFPFINKWNALDGQCPELLSRNCMEPQNPEQKMRSINNNLSNYKQDIHKASHPVEINILLLGETGVGKSTFINAFSNYLTFNTLQEAEQGELVVLIPVSFLTTTDDQFNEVLVKFGNVDPNEDHDYSGQSVTQQCRSYFFNINNKLCLRLIDTPGMCDTRGLVQDDKNINHIVSYIKNLSHLNAVLILFKPNATRLNVYMRSCITQLFTYLMPNVRNNIVFTFTNTRSTFFTPGNTAPLLKTMLQELNTNVFFNKANTFCFDNESFRYLIARKYGIKFDEFQTRDYHKSWTRSVLESKRILQYICSLPPHSMIE